MDAEVHLKLILKRISVWSFITAAGISGVSLVVRFSGWQIIPSISPDYIPLAPSAALCFIILSVSALLSVLRPDTAAARMSAAVGAGVTLLGCLAILIAFVMGT